MNCVTIKNLRVSFYDREILHDISVNFPANKISVILGRSGSGKSTLLRSINRLNECFDGYHGEGEIKISQIDSNVPLTELRRRIGIVFQSPNPLPMSIRKNITLPLNLAFRLPKSESENIMRSKLEQSGLWNEVKDRLDSPAVSLSGGQQQRLCIARVLALKPDVLLLDEPTASLDRSAANKIEDMILSLKSEVSVIMVSHSLQQAAKLADYAIVLEDGNILNEFDGDSLRVSINDGSLIKSAF